MSSLPELLSILDLAVFSLQFFNLKLDTFGPYSINYSRDGRLEHC